MAARDEIVAYANELLEVERFPEFAPAGLQVVGAERGHDDRVRRLVARASCSSGRRELGAELVLVHHGLFWRNEPLVVDAPAARPARGALPGDRLARRLPPRARRAPDARQQRPARRADRRDAERAVRICRARLHARPRSRWTSSPAGSRGVGRTPLVLRGRRPRVRRIAVVDRRRRATTWSRRARGVRRAADRRARGAERRHRARARDPPALRPGTTRRSSSACRRWRRTSPSEFGSTVATTSTSRTRSSGARRLRRRQDLADGRCARRSARSILGASWSFREAGPLTPAANGGARIEPARAQLRRRAFLSLEGGSRWRTT